jgi:putative SOS response-associated peptidase YedK
MCGRYKLVTDAHALLERFVVENVRFDISALRPRYNIAPSQDVPIIRQAGAGREMAWARWGLVPAWSKEPRTKYSTINARRETVADRPAYRNAFRHRRCLVPADGFYEWQHRGTRIPYHICMPDRSVFAFAGLWERWERSDIAFDSCTIIVTKANELMRPIHDRMPIILDPRDDDRWLDPRTSDQTELMACLNSALSEQLTASPVSRYVNSPRHDDARCIEAAGEDGA